MEAPLPDFFAVPWATKEGDLKDHFAQVSALPIAVNPNHGLNCFWQMPFRSRCRITLENQHPAQPQRCFYQINYALTDVPDDAAYFHAQYRRSNPQPYGEEYTIVDGIRGHGHYVGTSLGWGVLDDRWWGEGEIKFYLDGDQEFPTHLRHRNRGLRRRSLRLERGGRVPHLPPRRSWGCTRSSSRTVTC